jgi:hypothetical protein
MKTEKAIQVLRDYNLWRRGNEEMEQPDPREIGEAIDDVLMAIGDMEEEAKLHRGAITGWQNKWECAVELAAKAQAELDKERKEGEEQARLLGMGSEREAKLIAERDLWRAEAQRWREQALDLEAQIETAIKRIQWRQDNLDRGIKELKGDY